MTFLLAFAGFAVMAKVGSDAVGPAVGDLGAGVIRSLGDKRLGVAEGTAPGGIELIHHGFEEIFDVRCREHCIGVGRRLDVGVGVFIVDRLSWLLLVDGHLVDELFQFLVNNVSDGGDIVGRVAGSFAGELVLHAVFML